MRPRTTGPARHALLLPVLLAAGCTTDLALPEGVRASCAEGRRCPPGFRCAELVGRCVRAEGGDRTPPGIVEGSVHIEPDVASLGTEVRVRFAVTEPLDLPPVVTLHSEERPSLPLAEAGEDEYTYTYSPTGAEPQESVALTATLVDGSGNLAEDAAVGHVTFDFQPPPVTGIRAEDGSRFLRGGATGFVRLTVSETLSEAPRVVLDEEGVDLEVQADSAPPVYRYAYTVGPGDEPGPHGVTAFATDEAGNRARVSAADVLVFDFAPPAFREPPALVNPVARPGVVLGVEFELDEALGRLPDVELVPRGGGDPIPLAGGQQVGHRYAYAHEAAAEEEGDYRLAIHGHRDRADNPADPWTSDGLVVVDATKPRVTTGPTLNKTPSYYRATEHVEVFFTVSEDLGGREPVASLGTEPELQLEGCGVGRDGLVVCRLARALSGQERPEGPVGLLIELQDAAGNLALERAPLTLDFTYPRASADVVPRFANADSIVQVTVTVSEAMAYGYPILEHRLLPDGLWLRFADPEDRGLGYVFTRRAADGLESGRYAFRVDVRDLAGNKSDDLPLTFGPEDDPEGTIGLFVDAQAPRIVLVTEDPDDPVNPQVLPDRLLRDGEELTVSFSVTEALGEPPAVVLRQALPESISEDPDHRWTATWTVRGEPGDDGVFGFVVELADLAGNRHGDRDALGQVTLDFSPPRLMGTPVFERVDDAPRARIAQNAVWARAGSVVRVTFATDERTLAAPVVRVAGRESTLDDWETVWEPDDTLFEVRVPDPGEVEGAQTVEVQMTDLAGNEAVLELGIIRYDLDEPDPLDEDTQELVRLLRAPWGGEETGGAPLVELRGCPAPEGLGEAWGWCPADGSAAFEEAAWVTAYGVRFGVGGLECTGTVLGEGPAEAGALRLELAGDHSAVCVEQVDRAGNASGKAVVRHVGLLAGMGGKVPGRTEENQHVLSRVVRLDERRLGQAPNATEADAVGLAAVLAAGDGEVLSLTAQRTWQHYQIITAWHPSAYGEMMTFDRGRGRTTCRATLDLYEWVEGAWRRPYLEHRPRPRYEAPLVYDAARGRSVMFGGLVSDAAQEMQDETVTDELWEYGGRDWTRIRPEGPVPAPRYAHGLAYDPRHATVVLFGGYGGEGGETGLLGDTWLWDGQSWRELQLGEAAPPAMFGHRMVFQRRRGGVVLYGGCKAFVRPIHYLDRLCTEYSQEVWEWDGETWFRTPSGDPAPPARYYHGMAYDEGRDEVLVYGGVSYDPEALAELDPEDPDPAALGERIFDDVWVWSEERWTERHPPGTRPAGRANPALAYDLLSDRVLMVSGRCGLTDCNDTWLWDGLRWSQFIGVKPMGRSDAGMAWVPATGLGVLFGGINEHGGTMGDTHVWRSPVWTPVGPPSSPPARLGASLVLHVRDGTARPLLFGGCLQPGPAPGTCAQAAQDTWEWDGTTWLRREPPGPLPPARWQHAMAYEATNDRTVLFGGWTDMDGDGVPNVPTDDTWAWDGERWSPLPPSPDNPRGRLQHAMAHDAVRGRTVLFGGFDNGGATLGGTWELDGEVWERPVVQGAPPPGRAGHVLVFDPLRGRVFLAGGIRNEEGRRGWPAAVREWTGERWRDVTPTTGESPVGGVRAAGVFDREHRTVLLYGGEQISFRSNETWEWDADPDLRPALHMDLDLDFAGFALAELTSVVVTATAGGRGHTTNLVPNDDGIAIGDPLPGVDLLAWDAWRGAWVRLESNAADVEAPAPLLWESEGVAEARRLLLQRDLELHLALAPAHRSGNGPEEASVAVDHLEARIRYRWPVDEPD